MNTKLIGIVAGGVVLAAGIVAGAVWLWPEPTPPDPAVQTSQDVTKYMASKEFGKLDLDARQQYLEAARATGTNQGFFRRPSGDLTDEERRQLRQNMRPMMQQMMTERVTKYFELPPAEQVAYLDQMIDGMQAMRKQREQRRAEREASGETSGEGNRQRGDGRRRGRGFTPERMKRMIENTPPERRAQFVEFRKAMVARMQARGIDTSGGFHGPRGGGRP